LKDIHNKEPVDEYADDVFVMEEKTYPTVRYSEKEEWMPEGTTFDCSTEECSA